MLRPCLGLPNEPCNELGHGPRCAVHARAWKSLRNSDRPIAKALVKASPLCSWCGTTEDLTADHVVRLIDGGTHDGARRVLCRSCNTKANRKR